MQVLILGATGGTGRELLQQALDRGYQVTALARRPDAIKLTHPQLHVIAGDVMQPDSLSAALQGQDAVLSVVGKNSFRPMTFYRQSAANIVSQMEKAGVQRLIGLTSVGVLDKPVGPWWYIWFVKPLLRYIYEDMRDMERIIQKSPLDWTIIRPSRLFDGSKRGHYRVGSSGELTQASSISRADVADCMLNQLDSHTNWHKAVAIAY